MYMHVYTFLEMIWFLKCLVLVNVWFLYVWFLYTYIHVYARWVGLQMDSTGRLWLGRTLYLIESCIRHQM